MPKDHEPTGYHRIGLAQFSFNPAYVDPSGVSDVHEPVIPENQFQGLHRIADIPEIAALRLTVAQNYLRHIDDKIKSIVACAAERGVQLLVLPEYSVPPESLGTCKDLASRLEIVIVAGSHTLTHTAIEQYRSLGIVTERAGKTAGTSVCPVFTTDGKCTLFEKMTRSKWESEMIPGTPVTPVAITLNGTQARLQVLICLDAIQDPTPGQKRQFRDSTPTILAIPALTPDVNLFRNKALLVLASGRCVLFSNTADYGGSRLYARAERVQSWFAEQDGTEPLPKDAEALVTADVDLGHQYDIRKSTGEFFPVRGIQIYPFIYGGSNSVCRQYLEFLKEVRAEGFLPTIDHRRTVREFTTADARSFPSLMQAKLRHFLDHVDAPGLADIAAWRLWVDAVSIATAESTGILRARLCSSAISALAPSLLARYPSKVSQLAEAYSYLAKRYAAAVSTLPAAAATNPTPPADTKTGQEPPVTFEAPFLDREAILDLIRKSIETGTKSCHVIAGDRPTFR